MVDGVDYQQQFFITWYDWRSVQITFNKMCCTFTSDPHSSNSNDLILINHIHYCV